MGIDLQNQIRINISVISNVHEALTGLVTKFQTTASDIDGLITKINASVGKLGKGLEIKTPPNLKNFTTYLESLAKIKDLPDFTKLANGLKELSKVGKAPSATTWIAFFNALNTKFPNISKIVTDVERLGKAFKRIGENSQAVASLNQIASSAQKTEKAIGGLDRRARHNITTWDKFAQKVKNYSAYRVISQGIMAMQDAFSQGVGTIVEYHQSLKDLQAITLATDQDVRNMGIAIKDVASTTKFSATEVAGGMKILGQSGLTASESIKTIEAVANLATGTLSDMAQTVDLVTTAMRVFKIEAEDSAMIADTFANAVNRSKLTIEKLRTAFNYVGPIANEAGVAFTEVNAALGILANSGLRASTMGTGLRRVLAELVDPNKKFAEAAERVGITLSELNPETNDFTDVVRSLGVVLEDTQTAFDIFGKRGAAAALALTNSSAAYDQMLENVSASGTAARMAQTQMEGLGVTFKNLKDRVGVLAIALGEAGLIEAFMFIGQSLKALVILITGLANNTFAQFVVKATLGAVAAIKLGKAILFVGKTIRALFLAKVGPWMLTLVGGFGKVGAGATAAGTSVSWFNKQVIVAHVQASRLTRTIWAMQAAFAANPIGIFLVALTSAIALFATFSTSIDDSISKLRDLEQQQLENQEAVQGHIDKINELIEKQKELTLAEFATAQAQLLNELIAQYPAYTAQLVNASDKLTDLKVALNSIKSDEAKKELVTLKDKVIDLVKESEKTRDIQWFPKSADELRKIDAARLVELQNNILEVAEAGIKLKGSIHEIDWQALIPPPNADHTVNVLRQNIIKFVDAVEEKMANLERKSIAESVLAGSGKAIEYYSKTYLSLNEILTGTGAGFDQMKARFVSMTDAQKENIVGVDNAVVNLRKQIKDTKDAYATIADPSKEQIDQYLDDMKVYEDNLLFIQKEGSRNLSQFQRTTLAIQAAESAKVDAQEIKNKTARAVKIREIELDLKRELKIIQETPISLTSQIDAYEKQYTEIKNASKAFNQQLAEDVHNQVATEKEAASKKLVHANENAVKQAEILQNLADTWAIQEFYKTTKSKEHLDAVQKAFDAHLVVRKTQLAIKVNDEKEALKAIKAETKAAQNERKKAYAEVDLQISKDVADEVITHVQAQRKKLSASRAMHTELINIARTEFAKIQEMHFGPDTKEFQDAFAKLEKAITAGAKNTTSQLETVNKEMEKLVETYSEVKADMVEEDEKYTKKVKEIETTKKNDTIELEEETKNEIEAIDNELLAEREAIAKKYNDTIQELADERLQIEQDAAYAILSVNDSIDEKIRKLNQKGMTDSQKDADNQITAERKLAEGAKLVAEAKKNGDEAALKRGEQLIAQAEALYGGLSDTDEATDGLNRVRKAAHDAIKAGEDIDISTNDEKVKEAEELKALEETNAQTVHDKAITDIGIETAKELEKINTTFTLADTKENERHAKKMANLDAEYAKTIAAINATGGEQRDIQLATGGGGGKKINPIAPEVDNSGIQTGEMYWDESKQLWTNIVNDIGENPIKPKIDNSDLQTEAGYHWDETKQIWTNIVDEVEATPIKPTVDNSEVVTLKNEVNDLQQITSQPIILNTNVLGIDRVQEAVASIALLKDKVVTITTRYISEGSATGEAIGAFNGGLISHFAKGGQAFRKLTSPLITAGKGFADDVPAMLSNHEFVHRARAVKKYGVGFMNSVNNLQFPKILASGGLSLFAEGGLAGFPDLNTKLDLPESLIDGFKSSIDNSSISTYNVTIGNKALSPRGRVGSLTKNLINEVRNKY